MVCSQTPILLVVMSLMTAAYAPPPKPVKYRPSSTLKQKRIMKDNYALLIVPRYYYYRISFQLLPSEDNLAICDSYTINKEGKLIIHGSGAGKTESLEECLICCDSINDVLEEGSSSGYYDLTGITGSPIKDCECACNPSSSCDSSEGIIMMLHDSNASAKRFRK